VYESILHTHTHTHTHTHRILATYVSYSYGYPQGGALQRMDTKYISIYPSFVMHLAEDGQMSG